MRKIFFLILFLLTTTWISAQELNCRVQVRHSSIQGSNTQIFNTLQTELTEFMNSHKWTSHKFGVEERIECSFTIDVTEYSGNFFKATLMLQASRPVFGSSYKTTLLNHQEAKGKFEFEYKEHETLEFNESTYTSNLISTFAFYAYFIIGLDYDTMGKNGGSEFYRKAKTIVDNAQSSDKSGWKSFENDKNRYWLIDYIFQNDFTPYRDFLYRYHRKGLDQMSEKIASGRREIVESLRFLQKVQRAKPTNILLTMLSNAKSKEIVDIFSDESVPTSEKTKVVNIMKEVDAAHINEYDKILK